MNELRDGVGAPLEIGDRVAMAWTASEGWGGKVVFGNVVKTHLGFGVRDTSGKVTIPPRWRVLRGTDYRWIPGGETYREMLR